MKRTILIILAIVISFCLGFFLKEFITDKCDDSINENQSTISVELNKVTGIGGVFFKCEDPDKIKDWYKRYLGFDINQFGVRFEWEECTDPPRRSGIQWSPMTSTENYFEPSVKEFMINYTVDNLDKLVDQLKRNGVELLDTIEIYEYGKFVHLMDLEGNKIELFEPNYEYGISD